MHDIVFNQIRVVRVAQIEGWRFFVLCVRMSVARLEDLMAWRQWPRPINVFSVIPENEFPVMFMLEVLSSTIPVPTTFRLRFSVSIWRSVLRSIGKWRCLVLKK